MCIKGFSYIGRLLKLNLGYDHLPVWGNKLPDPTVFYERILEKNWNKLQVFHWQKK
jgi:hypothetical protein